MWLCYCVYSKHSSPYSSLFGWGVGMRSSMQQQVSCSAFYPLVCQTYKAANCGMGKWAADLLQKTKLFRTQLCAKPCYVRAMEICSTFSCCKHCKMVAWGGIEPPTQGFSALIDRFDYVRLQADAAPIKFGVRVSVLLYTLLNFASCVKVFALYPSDVFYSFFNSLCFSPQKL